MENVSATGFPWYTESDYANVLKVMSDRHLLHDHFGEWLKAAEKQLKELHAAGQVTAKAHLNSVEFAAWCQRLNIDPDSHARRRWASEVAFRHQGQAKTH